MGRVDPVCIPFVLQMGPIPATNGALSTPKPPQKLIFVCKNSGTRRIFAANTYVFNNFPVPQNAWDKPGTRLGQAKQRDRKSFFKIREKSIKIARK
jgi:hypothetical protein